MADHLRVARALQVVARGLGRVGREVAAMAHITPQQADAIELLATRGVLSTSLFADLLGIDPSTASRNLAGLERAGLIARRRDAEDGRQTELRLTPKGKRVAEAISTRTAHTFGALLERVPRGERSRVTEALDVLARAVTWGEVKK